jgi:hypothetical protein
MSKRPPSCTHTVPHLRGRHGEPFDCPDPTPYVRIFFLTSSLPGIPVTSAFKTQSSLTQYLWGIDWFLDPHGCPNPLFKMALHLHTTCAQSASCVQVKSFPHSLQYLNQCKCLTNVLCCLGNNDKEKSSIHV